MDEVLWGPRKYFLLPEMREVGGGGQNHGTQGALHTLRAVNRVLLTFVLKLKIQNEYETYSITICTFRFIVSKIDEKTLIF